MHKGVGFISTLIYTGISLATAGAFFAVTTLGGYSLVARAGGAAWVFLLSMIILMPIVTPRVKRKLQRE